MAGIVVSEKAFQAAVVELARLLGWRVHYVRHSIGSPHGWPDLVLCNGDRLLFRELKSDTGRVTAEQSEWGELLTTAGMDWAVWRPADWMRIESTTGTTRPRGGIVTGRRVARLVDRAVRRLAGVGP